LASSEVAVAGALDAIFGRSGRANMRKKRPFASKTTMPFGLGPYDWTLLPFGRACSQEARVQVPTSWSLIDHCWLIALLGNAVSANIMRTLRRFMFPLPGAECGHAKVTTRARSLDHLVGNQQNVTINRQSHFSRSLHVDDQLELCWPFDR